MQLLSAQGTEAATATLFFLYLAWLDSTVYGSVMYGLAAGSIVMRVIQFGLYYPMVSDLGQAGRDKAPEIVFRVLVIKAALLLPAMLGVVGTGLYRGLSPQVFMILLLISLGFSLEAIADTFFGELRVRGKQAVEARIKIVASVSCYGYGFLAAFLGLDPVFVGLFKVISGIIALSGGLAVYWSEYSSAWRERPEIQAVWKVFRAAAVFALIEILGIVYNKTNIFFLESVAGVKGVAFYSATWNLVDPVSTLVSEQFLGWVIFPLLAAYWWNSRERVGRLVRSNARWLLAVAFPIMFVMWAESSFIIGLIYPAEYKDAVWMQQYLVWTILLSFQNNLFSYVMMVAGAAKVLLAFAAAVTVLNLVFNLTLVEPLGLAGGCLVIIFTKLSMTILTYLYCRISFGFVKTRDFVVPVAAAGGGFGLFLLLSTVLPVHGSVLITVAAYLCFYWKVGTRLLGPLPSRSSPDA